MRKEDIVQRIREKIATGRLPSAPPREVWGGRGTGAICAACDRAIAADEPEIEADCIDNVPRFYHVHCHALMEQERGKTSS